MAFHVGQFVVCVDDRWVGGPAPIKRGVVYTVERVGTSFGELGVYAGPPSPCLWLVEARNDFSPSFPDHGFDARRFRPLKDETLSVFRQALEPSPKQTETA